jgi:hypothetical protein
MPERRVNIQEHEGVARSDICLLYWGHGKKSHGLIPTHPLQRFPRAVTLITTGMNFQIINMPFLFYGLQGLAVSTWQRIAYVSEEGVAALGISTDYGQRCKPQSPIQDISWSAKYLVTYGYVKGKCFYVISETSCSMVASFFLQYLCLFWCLIYVTAGLYAYHRSWNVECWMNYERLGRLRTQS